MHILFTTFKIIFGIAFSLIFALILYVLDFLVFSIFTLIVYVVFLKVLNFVNPSQSLEKMVKEKRKRIYNNIPLQWHKFADKIFFVIFAVLFLTILNKFFGSKIFNPISSLILPS